MRAAWRSMTWTIGFLMGTRNLADWWQVLIGLERTSQQQKRPHCRQKAVILLDVGCYMRDVQCERAGCHSERPPSMKSPSCGACGGHPIPNI